MLWCLTFFWWLNVYLSSSLPCRKADFISVVFNDQFLSTAIEINNRIAPLPTVGLSLGISRSFSSNLLTTNLALVCPFLFVITHLVDNTFCPLSFTSSYVSTELIFLVHLPFH